ncbi:hypothetical protein [Streptomyces sp. JJ38]|uniref:hypothetical protein n=1 Tax=Streptomyces sp. JJ38 TaxID=2738128 RepID=UPI001C5A23B9|nr:hypothetical protein [Streptomyces sp. JJ38]MBW1599973.1 hypothetical protein [Streptomyces sp. JJ38]
MKIRSKFGAALTAGVTAVITLAMASPASAANSYKQTDLKNTDSGLITLYENRKPMGQVRWNSDPFDWSGHISGDHIYAEDTRSDGYGILGDVRRVSDNKLLGRASTWGQPAPSTVKDGENVDEGTRIKYRACVVHNHVMQYCSQWFFDRA